MHSVLRVDRLGHFEVVPGSRPVAEGRCGQARAQPGIPTSGLARDRLLESFPGDGVLTGLEGDRATDPVRIGVKRIEVGGGLEIVGAPWPGRSRADRVAIDTSRTDRYAGTSAYKAASTARTPAPAARTRSQPGRRGSRRRPRRPAARARPERACHPQEPERRPAESRDLPEPVDRAVDQPDDQRQGRRPGDKRLEPPPAPGAHRGGDRRHDERDKQHEADDPGVREQPYSMLCVYEGSWPVCR